ncbi:MAG: hypothetical protein H7X83_11010 [Verrucomicrobia bacterium]|nr:hypothetical protein [Deltaproteobacteria bacterium]
MSLKNAALQTYRTSATQGPDAQPQASTPSYSVRISKLAENLAQGKDSDTPALRTQG